jgi:hypothetical protein
MPSARHGHTGPVTRRASFHVVDKNPIFCVRLEDRHVGVFIKYTFKNVRFLGLMHYNDYNTLKIAVQICASWNPYRCFMITFISGRQCEWPGAQAHFSRGREHTTRV